MPNKCCVYKCKGNYNPSTRCSVVKVPNSEPERAKWLAALPKRAGESGKPFTYGKRTFICINHWPGFPNSVPHKRVAGGKLVPLVPPTFFAGIPRSCIPVQQHHRRVSTMGQRQLEIFNKQDIITNFDDVTSQQVEQRFGNVIMRANQGKTAWKLYIFNDDVFLGIIELSKDQKTLSNIVVSALDAGGNIISLSNYCSPNNQLMRWSQLEASINAVRNHKLSVMQHLETAKAHIQAANEENNVMLEFMVRQIDLHISKRYNASDYLFAAQVYPRITYASLREWIILPAVSKMRALKSAVNPELLVQKTLKRATSVQQKVCIMIIDEVKVKSRLIFAGHHMHGYAEDEPSKKARSVLCMMMRCLHGGYSSMVSLTPIYSLTAAFQKMKFEQAMRLIHKNGGHVIAVVADGLKGNQLFMKMFRGYNNNTPWVVPHPLSPNDPLFLLNDTVHILKNLRNNWITEKCKTLSLNSGESVGKWCDIEELYEKDKGLLLTLTRLTRAAVFPTPIQRQNVNLVLQVFNDKTIAALQSFGNKNSGTIDVLRTIVSWWKTVNVKTASEHKHSNDTLRLPVDGERCEALVRLSQLSNCFKQMQRHSGSNRYQCLTSDTHFALWRTTEGLIHLSLELLRKHEYKYVLLGSIQSDRLEAEFGCFRSMTGSNYYMTAYDVIGAFKSRGLQLLAKLKEVDCPATNLHVCSQCKEPFNEEISNAIDSLAVQLPTLTPFQISVSVYIVGYLCAVTPELSMHGDLVSAPDSDFVQFLSRGFLVVPTQAIATWVQLCVVFFNMV